MEVGWVVFGGGRSQCAMNMGSKRWLECLGGM